MNKSQIMKRRWQDPSYRKRMIEGQKKNPSKYWKGKHRTELTKEKISESLKGCIPWNLGKHPTTSHKNKARESLKKYWNTDKGKERKLNGMLKGKNHPLFGKPRSKETKRKLREAHLGKKQTEDTKIKRSNSLKGRISWIKGKHHSEETKIKMRLSAHRGKESPRWKGGITPEINKRVNSFEWRQIRQIIYKRDNWQCQICGKHCRKDIQCHHILPVAENGTDNFINLSTLGRKHHAKIEQSEFQEFWRFYLKQHIKISLN